MNETRPSPKSRAVALALAIAVPLVGLHRFYVGKVGTGILMLLTAGGLGMWWIYDVIMLAAGSFRDTDGRRVSQWAETEPDDPAMTGADPRKQELMLQELDLLRGEMAELNERVDFMERMLARANDRGAIPRS